MASVVSVIIKGEDNLSGTLNKASASLEAFKQGIVEGARAELAAHQATQKTTQVYSAFADASGKAALSQRNLGSAITIVGSQVGGLGPLANLASNAITTMTLASGPAGIALGALAATIGLLMYRIEQAREGFRQLAEIELADLARQTKAANLENDIKRRVEILKSAKPEIAEITQRYRELRIELEKQGARPQALAATDQARNLEIAAVQRKEAEKAAEKAQQAQEKATREQEQQAKAIAAARDAIENQIEAVRTQRKALDEGEEAAAEYAISHLAASESVKKLGTEGMFLVEVLRDERLALIAANNEKERQALLEKSIAEGIAARGQVIEREMAQENSLLQEQLNLRTKLAQQAGDFELQKLRAGGRPEHEVLARQLELLREQEQKLQNAPQITTEQNTEQKRIQQEIELTETRLAQFGKVTIDIGKAVADTMADIAHGIATGTLQGFDVVKAAGAAALNLVTDVFRQTLAQKLSFEVQLMTNMRGLPAQMNGALTAGAQAVPGGGGGGGGILSFLGLGGGGAPAGVEGPLMQNGSFFSGGSDGGFSLGGLGLGAGLGALMALPQLFSGGFTGKNIGSTIGSIGGGAAGSFFGPVGSVIGSFLGNMLGGLIGGLFGKTNPTVNVRSQIEGIVYDALANEFKPGSIMTKASGKDISGSVVTSTKNQVQELLEGWSRQWTDILNIFPSVVHDRMIPTLEAANQRLQHFFGKLKFTEGGSRTIAQELEDLEKAFGPRGFFFSLRQTLGTGIGQNLQLAGLGGLQSLVDSAFPLLDISGSGGAKFANAMRLPGLKPARGKDQEPFIQALTNFIQLTSGLAQVGGPGGISQFLTEQDRARLEGGIGDVLKIQDGKQFTKEANALVERVKPITDFLNNAVQQSADLFGRGIMAALDAASGSSAIRNFNRILGDGVKETIFAGITESILASSQFNDLLAPLQRELRDITQQAIATGEIPSADVFRSRLLPHVESIGDRTDILQSILIELQKLGLDFKTGLGGLRGGGNGGGTIQFLGPVSMNNEQDAEELLHRLDAHIRGLSPAN